MWVCLSSKKAQLPTERTGRLDQNVAEVLVPRVQFTRRFYVRNGPALIYACFTRYLRVLLFIKLSCNAKDWLHIEAYLKGTASARARPVWHPAPLLAASVACGVV